MGLKFTHVRSWVIVLAVVCVLLSSTLPLAFSQAATIPSGPCPAYTTEYPYSAVILKSLTLTGDCSYAHNGIYLDASGIALDCAGYTITYTGTPYVPVKPSGTPTPGKPPQQLKSEQPINLEGIGVVGNSSDTIQNCKVTAFYGDIAAVDSPKTTIKGNTVTDGYMFGIYVALSPSSEVSGNTATDNPDGIYLFGCFSCKVSGNTATGNTYDGFYFEDSVGTSVSGNTANNNYYGFYQDWSDIPDSHMTLTGNTANSNSQVGYYDATYGSGTYGLGNTYSKNTCSSNGVYGSYAEWWGYGPAHLCTPQG